MTFQNICAKIHSNGLALPGVFRMKGAESKKTSKAVESSKRSDIIQVISVLVSIGGCILFVWAVYKMAVLGADAGNTLTEAQLAQQEQFYRIRITGLILFLVGTVSWTVGRRKYKRWAIEQRRAAREEKQAERARRASRSSGKWYMK